MTDSKKLRETDFETKGSSTLYGLWSVGFISAFMNIAIIMSSGRVNNVIYGLTLYIDVNANVSSIRYRRQIGRGEKPKQMPTQTFVMLP